jgi:phthalate 4,5-cis-dihydrodiol dehydrogenase
MVSAKQGGRKLRVGIAGLGVATMNLLPELAVQPLVTIVAAADPRPAARDKFASEFGGTVYRDIEELCKDPNVELLYICTPTHLHAQHAVMAAEHRKHIVADKPMALTLEDCDKIINAVERNGVKMIVGHSQSLDLPIVKMAEIVHSGQLGRPIMFNTWGFMDWVYRPRGEEEFDATKGAGVVYRQGPIQVDILRMLGGGLVRSVRGMTSAIDKDRPFHGSYIAYLEFQDGTPAMMVYSGYGHFDTTEITFTLGLQGFPVSPEIGIDAHRQAAGFKTRADEYAYKDSTRYGGSRSRPARSGVPSADRAGNPKRHAFYGFTLVSCEKGDIRQYPQGLIIYGDNERKELPVPAGEDFSLRYTTTEVQEIYTAIVKDAPVALHDARWHKATLEVLFGVIQSAKERREVTMHHQTPYRGPAYRG